MTGCPPKFHGDRVFTDMEMPPLPTMAQTFRDAGYQAFAVGKLHVHPQRARIGFDDVILAEEGRSQWGVTDDYEAYLTAQGLAGQQFLHGMGNNAYVNRPWHLDEAHHPTNWATREMARLIRRRDPSRPGFWYLSYNHPHPPLAPLRDYVDMYRDRSIDVPGMGEWAEDPELLPHYLRHNRDTGEQMSDHDVRSARRAFYALCTQIDHQLRIVIGTLREEGLLENTVILFTSDHGDMLGKHGLWAKRLFYEESAQVPMILLGTAAQSRDGVVPPGTVDERLVGWQDVMPTLLGLAGVPVPGSVQGRSMLTGPCRETLYGEVGENANATRMLHDGRFKLIYYPVGNRVQLFDLQTDPGEFTDLSASAEHADICQRLQALLIQELYGSDQAWLRNGNLAGLPDEDTLPRPDRGLSGQRGLH